jgi:hypothetical protein
VNADLAAFEEISSPTITPTPLGSGLVVIGQRSGSGR